MEEQKGRGGRREGAGRKKALVPRTPYSIRLTKEEYAYIRECLEAYRAKKKAE